MFGAVADVVLEGALEEQAVLAHKAHLQHARGEVQQPASKGATRKLWQVVPRMPAAGGEMGTCTPAGCTPHTLLSSFKACQLPDVGAPAS